MAESSKNTLKGFLKPKDKKDEDAQKQKEQRYRGVFRTPPGRIVLLEILTDLGFFSRVETEEERILHNFAHDLAELGGGVEIMGGGKK